MPKIEFAGRSAEDTDNRSGQTERLVNCYPEPLGDRSRFVIKSVLGLESAVATGELFAREMLEVKGNLYAAAGDKIVKITKGGSASTVGTIVASDATSLGAVNGDLCICAGGRYYVSENGGTPERIQDGRFLRYGSLATLGQYVVLTQEDGREFLWSDLADPKTLPGLNFQTADGRDDNILRAAAINGNLWLFKQESIEVWYITGGSGADVFERLSGGVIDTGLKSFGLLTTFDGGAFFVGDDGIAYITQGAGLQPVSTPAVETAIEDGDPAKCFYYEDEGHKFCVIRFADRPAWVYDLSTRIWHERASGVEHDPWLVLCAEKAHGRQYAGDILGSVYQMTRSNKDGSTPLKRTMTSKTVTNQGNRFRVPKLEIYANSGWWDADLVNEAFQNGGLYKAVTSEFNPPAAFPGDLEWWDEGDGGIRSRTAAVTKTVDGNSYAFEPGLDGYFLENDGGAISDTTAINRFGFSSLGIPSGYTNMQFRVTYEYGKEDTSLTTGMNVKDSSDTTLWSGSIAAGGARWTTIDTGWQSVPDGQTSIRFLTTQAGNFFAIRDFRWAVTYDGADEITGEVDETRDAQVMLRVSRDYGATWGDELWRSLGKRGEYDNRMIWRSLGQSRQFTFEFSITDPVDVQVLNTGDISLG